MLLDQLKSILSTVHIQGLNGEEPDLTLLNTHFQHTNLKEVGKFYDRDECAQDWYYQCYSKPTPGLLKAKPHTVAGCLVITNYNNPILVMKNGPVHGSWQHNLHIDLDAVACTIWCTSKVATTDHRCLEEGN